MKPHPFMVHDLVGSALALTLFVIVFVAPGYTLSWVFDLFRFRRRDGGSRVVFSVMVSNAVSPVGLFWLYRFGGHTAGISALIIFAAACGAITMAEFRARSSVKSERRETTAATTALWAIAGAWSLVLVVLLVDWQIGRRLYFSAVSYDYTTRVAVIDAITRTGAPPSNPGYFPGAPTHLTFLYYFWYILGSAVDQMAGDWVTPYNAMIASVAWCGLIVLATAVGYLTVRSNQSGRRGLTKAWLPASLFLVGGLDFIPVVLIMWQSRRLFGHIPFGGRIEGWNMPVMSWMNAVTWVPNHVAGAMACFTGLLLVADGRDRSVIQRRIHATVAGLAFASALGLSVWLPLVFALVWTVWIGGLLVRSETRTRAADLVIAGVVGVLAAFPFMFDVFHASGSSVGGNGLHPVQFFVRPFALTEFFGFQGTAATLSNLLLLPVNYLFELGVFFIVGLAWLKKSRSHRLRTDSLEFVEVAIVLVVLLVTSFVRSTLIALNDLGMRAWLLAQFVLVVWAVDLVLEDSNPGFITPGAFRSLVHGPLARAILAGMVVIGFLTTGLEITAVRAWAPLVDAGVVGFPNELSPDRQLGERTYDAREAYTFVNENSPDSVVMQANPLVNLDRPAGLYSGRQWAISDRTAYGVPNGVLASAKNGVGSIFDDSLPTWAGVDSTCRKYFIDLLVIRDTDPIWNDGRLMDSRRSLFRNRHYAVYPCGSDDQASESVPVPKQRSR